jgi:D-3-phosphoglycerate dehydrogenase
MVMAKVLFTENVDPTGPEMLEKAGWEVVMANRDAGIIEKEIETAEAVVVRILDLTPELLARGKNLKIVSKHGVGYDNIPVEWCKAHGIAVTIAPGANSQSVAEHTIALMMALAKNLAIVTKAYREKGFAAKNSAPGMEINGKTLGIIGVGHIGSRVAKMGLGLGMKVLAYDPYVKSVPDGVVMTSDKDEVVRNADVLTLHPVLTPETKNIIGARELAMMKPTALFINCGRGPLVDEPALIKALQEKRIAGAGMDVTWSEPCEPDSPLFAMENVLLTPHYAPTTRECAMNVSRVCCQNVLDVMAGKKPEGLL